MKKRLSKPNIVLLLVLVFSLSLSTGSFADNTDLDRSSYVDGSQYDNEDIDIKHVKVGLLYDKQATDRIYLDVLDGAGFQFLTYNAQREGRELGRVDTNHIVVIKDNFYSDSELSTKCYHVRLNHEFYSYSDARAEADKYEDGFPAYYHGNTVSCSVLSIRYLKQMHMLQITVWMDTEVLPVKMVYSFWMQQPKSLWSASI